MSPPSFCYGRIVKRPCCLEKFMSHAHAILILSHGEQAGAPFLRGGDYSEAGQFDFIMTQNGVYAYGPTLAFS